MKISFNLAFCLPFRSFPIPKDERIGAWRCRLPWRVRKRVRPVTTLQENVSNGDVIRTVPAHPIRSIRVPRNVLPSNQKERAGKWRGSHDDRFYMRKIRGESFHRSNNGMILPCIPYTLGSRKWHFQETVSWSSVEDHGTSRGARERNIGRGIERKMRDGK